jgi:TRAP-type mannitol/chloroaromatic compound transport system permease large subunit
MIPPSIVLIIYGLVTETSIKALFTGAFVPGFMLASFIIIYIIIRTNLNPSLAPLPDPEPGDPEGREKWAMFGGFMSILLAGVSGLLLLRALFFTATGQNTIVVEDNVEPIFLGMTYHLPYLIGAMVLGLALIFVVFGRARSAEGWKHGKGMVPPFAVIGVVMGSIYGGISGITEAAGMGALAVFVIAAARGQASVELVWDAIMRTLRSTGTIIWVTIGAAALAGAYTLAGGPNYIANLIVGSEMPTMLVLLTMMLILLFMGAFMDWVGIVLLIIPVFLPIVKKLPLDEIGLIGQLEPKYVSVWFGVLFCMNMQVSFLSPPFGPAAFYLKSVAPPHISLTDIFRGFLPFICIQLLALSVMLIWPPIVEVLLP